MAETKSARDFLNGPAGRLVTVAFLVLAAGVAGYVIYSYLRPNEAVTLANSPVFVDADSGKAFHQSIGPDMTLPVKSPFSGKLTGYPAELCYWTKDGTAKTEPTAVLLNELVGKTGPTFCPDCGRLVVHHNPTPQDTKNAPPTEAEYSARVSSR